MPLLSITAPTAQMPTTDRNFLPFPKMKTSDFGGTALVT